MKKFARHRHEWVFLEYADDGAIEVCHDCPASRVRPMTGDERKRYDEYKILQAQVSQLAAQQAQQKLAAQQARQQVIAKTAELSRMSPSYPQLTITAGLLGFNQIPAAVKFTPNVAEEESDGSVIRGWRQYVLTPDGLLGARETLWTEATQRAECRAIYILGDGGSGEAARAAHDHLAQGVCSCGIYLSKEKPIVDAPVRVLAECVGWGECVEHDPKGYRCEYVRIERFIMPPEWGLLKTFGVPIEEEKK